MLNNSMKLAPVILLTSRKTFHAKQKITLSNSKELGPGDLRLNESKDVFPVSTEFANSACF
jgi:hypothetical protein